MILETILTTQDPGGAVNCAPMGVEWSDEEIVIKPFLETTTFRNLRATGVGVVNLTDDVMLFAQAALFEAQFPVVPAAVVFLVSLQPMPTTQITATKSTSAITFFIATILSRNV